MNCRTVAALVLLSAAATIMPAAFADHPQITITINPYHSGCVDADSCYTPGADVAVDVGGEISWINGDDMPRRIAGSAVGGGPTTDSDASSIVTLNPGDSYTWKFNEEGTYRFYDPDHPQVAGTVTVQTSGDAGSGHDDGHHGAGHGDDGHHGAEEDDEYDRTVTVGGVFDTSGDWALTGGEIKAAAEMAESDFNGFLRNIKADWRLDIAYEDSQTSGPAALDKVQSLNGREVKLLVGMALSSHLQIAYQYTESNDMLVVSCCSTAAHLAIDDHIFRLRPDDSRQAPAMNTMLQNAGIEVLYMVNRNDAWGDGVFYVGFDKIIQLAEILKNYENASNVRWFASNVQAGADQYLDNPVSREFFETTRFTAVKTVTPDNPLRQDLNERIRAIYDREPSIYSHSAYDSVWLLGYAIHMTQSTDADTLKAVIPLVAERMEGSFGSLRLTDAGDVASEYYEVWTVRDGEWIREYDITANAAG